ncbi:cupin domain-containing protein [Deinococcus apachensis]|uniref:cupin domain-containing protein n=1 Tax=Deinococcus apachensis TaxID=309886 RepID=UPI00039C55E2|nr:cupin domain-containing protein [Deinococcus apachensis]
MLRRGEDTGGAFALVEECVQAGLEPPPHLHTHEDETFYLLEGEVEFQVGDRRHRATPGDCVFLPRGLPHAFKLRSPTARLLVLLTPGGVRTAARRGAGLWHRVGRAPP